MSIDPIAGVAANLAAQAVPKADSVEAAGVADHDQDSDGAPAPVPASANGASSAPGQLDVKG